MTTTQAGGRPSRASIHAAVDDEMRLIGRIGGLPHPSVASDIWDGIWHEETHHSTAIEGNTLILREVRRLLDEGRAVGDKELKEYLEVQGYADAAKWVYSQASDGDTAQDQLYISLTELREIHRLVVSMVWDVAPPLDFLPGEGPGSFRLHDIRPFGKGMTPAPFADIAPRISDWLRFANSEPDGGLHLMEHLAKVHADFERIHPFRDGNGRSGRLVLNLILVRRGYAPIIVYKRDRERYLKALERSDKGDNGTLGELIARGVRDSLDRFLIPVLAGPFQLVPISALSRRDVSALSLRRAAEKGRLRAQRRSSGWFSTPQWVDQYLTSRRRGKPRAGRPTPEPVVGRGMVEEDGFLVIPPSGAPVDDGAVREFREADERRA